MTKLECMFIEIRIVFVLTWNCFVEIDNWIWIKNWNLPHPTKGIYFWIQKGNDWWLIHLLKEKGNLSPKSVAPKIWQKCTRKSFHRIFSFRRVCESVLFPHNIRRWSFRCKRRWHKSWPMISNGMTLFLWCVKVKNGNEDLCSGCLPVDSRHRLWPNDNGLPGADRVIGITANARNNTSNNLWSR